MWYEIFKFELKYRARRPDTYIYFIILFLYSIIAVDVIFEGQLDPLKRNAPIVIARTMGIISALFMMVISMIMGVSILRDFDHQMESLMFVNPIKKSDYLLGRFLGSFMVLIFIFISVPLGMAIGDFMPWLDSSKLLPFDAWYYLQPFLFLVIPTLFYGGAIFFVTGALSRKLLVVYTQGFFFLVIYLLSISLAAGAEDLTLTALLEPFTFQSIRISTQAWTTIDRNSLMVPIEGVLLSNRLIWSGIGILALLVGNYFFKFSVIQGKASRKQLTRKQDTSTSTKDLSQIKIPSFRIQHGLKSSLRQLLRHAIFNFKSILKEVPFWTIVLCGTGILVISSFDVGTTFGVDSYPKTYLIVGELMENTILFFLAIVIFYSGELIWKERDAKISDIADALPMSDFIHMAGKFIGLILTYVVIMLVMIIAGISFQASNGYYQFELDVYFSGLFVEIFPFLVLLTFIAFFFQSIVNHKFLGHLVVVIFVFASTLLLAILGLDHGLYSFGGGALQTYSDMNGYGHFLTPYLWFKVYWTLFALLMFVVAVVLFPRGKETQLVKRFKAIKYRLTRPLLSTTIVILTLFSLSGCYIFYNTNVLNEYSSQSDQQLQQVSYEKELKQFEHMPQPKIVDVYLEMELYPSNRNFEAEGYYILTNTEEVPISEIHIQKLPNDQVTLTYVELDGGSNINNQYEWYSYSIHGLVKPLYPGDSIKMKFKQEFTSHGFQQRSGSDIVYNGTFFDNFYFPTIGYNNDIELRDNEDRSAYDLNPKSIKPAIDDPFGLKEGRSDGDGEEINFEIIIGTDGDQTAVAPGYLQKEWKENDRNYYHYKMDKPMSNFYSIVSAEYQVKKDEWKPQTDSLGDKVSLEIYYHEGHEYNLDRMMKGMKSSFDYMSQNFGAYQYQQMRILEVPVYASKAQSFPNTVPFSEDLGFVMNIDDQEDVDMAFYVIAHELAHQWWGHQVNPAHVQGQSMINESLAQYSALMILKNEFPESKVVQLVKSERKKYFKGRNRERSKEMPMNLVESGQSYVYYAKGLVNFYALQDYISEDSVNVALRRFIKDWDSFDGLIKKQTDNYPTTIDLISYFRDVTPDSLQYVISDLFETITTYENVIRDSWHESSNNGKYLVNLTTDFKKYQADSLGIDVQVNLNDWIEIGIYAEDENGNEELIYCKKHLIKESLSELQIEVDKEPTKVEIDPKLKLLDRDIRNNVKTLEEKS
ncbi:ABC transporter permease/M1 family aminopeptidase [Ekhidna sp.]